MSSTLLRLGLWVTLIVVILYVLRETYEDMPAAEYMGTSMLQKALVVGVFLVIAGVVARLLEKGASKAAPKNRCAVCRVAIVKGAIYCRAHLRTVLEREDERTHMTRVRRR
jgi:predicted nucleic acid-binding Zn ribbon protein